MKATVFLVLLGLSSAFAAEKEKKNSKRGTLEESLAYGYGLGDSSFDLNKSLRSSLGNDIVAVDAIQSNGPVNTQIPESFDLGATVSRHTTFTKNVGIVTPQAVPISVERTVTVPQTYQVAVPQTVQVPVHQTVQVPVQHAVQVPVSQAVQVPIDNHVPVQIGQQVPVHFERTFVPVQRRVVVSLYNIPLVPARKEVLLTGPAPLITSQIPAQVYTNAVPLAPSDLYQNSHVQIASHEALPSQLVASAPITHAAPFTVGPVAHNAGPYVQATGPIAHTAGPLVQAAGPLAHNAGPYVQAAGSLAHTAGPLVQAAGPLGHTAYAAGSTTHGFRSAAAFNAAPLSTPRNSFGSHTQSNYGYAPSLLNGPLGYGKGQSFKL